MILHEPRVDEYFLPFLVVLSTNLVVLFTNHLLFYYSSPKTSEDPHEFIVKLQQYLLDELENSKDNPGRTLHGEKYVEDLFLTMKAFWDQFTGEITHETTCTSTSCKRTFEDQESFTFLLLKFPELDHNEDCTVDSLIKHYLPKEQCLEPRDCICSDKRIPGIRNSTITNFPSFICILLCRKINDKKDTIPSAVEFPAFDFDINGDGMRYDLSATVHYKKTKDGNGHYTAISRSQDLQSQRWFMYDDERVSVLNFTNMNNTVKRGYMKTAAILFYVSQSIIETRIKNANTIDLMEGGKDEQAQNVPNSEMNCCDEDGKEGHADGSSKDVPIQPDSEGAEQMVDMCENGKEGKADDSSDGDDKMDGEEVEEESGAAAHVDQARGILPQIYIPPVDPHEKRDTEQHVLPRRLPTRPAITRTQQREDYALLRQIESEQLRAKQRAQQCANDVLDPSVPNSEEGAKGSSSDSSDSSSSGSSSDSSDSSSSGSSSDSSDSS
jgi:hypothetical protein